MPTQSKRSEFLDKIITIDGDTWRVVGVGATDADGFIYMHLASTTRFRDQKNGRSPVQAADWLAPEIFGLAENMTKMGEA